MKQLVFLLFLGSLITLGAAMFYLQDTGSISVRFAGASLEADLLEVSAGLFVLVIGIILFLSLLSLIRSFLSLIGFKTRERKTQLAHESMEQGLIELAEGNFEDAEKLLLDRIAYNRNPLLAYLSAARAAQKRGAHDSRDRYLRRAYRTNPNADIAIGLTQAELQFAHEQYEQALATLKNLHQLAPKHAYVLYLLAKTHRELGEWAELQALMPQVRQANVFTDDKLLPIEIATWQGLFVHVARHRKLSDMTRLWSEVPGHLRGLPEIVRAYAESLLSMQEPNVAESVLRKHLDNSWDDQLMQLYAEMDVFIDSQQIDKVESWLQHHRHDPWLLLTLGNLCKDMGLWGKARNYYEASLSVLQMPVTHLQLARLLEEHMGELEIAQQHYKEGLSLVHDDGRREDQEQQELPDNVTPLSRSAT